MPHALFGKNFYHIPRTYMAFLPCGYSGVFSDRFFVQNENHIDCTHKASHSYGHAGVVPDYLFA